MLDTHLTQFKLYHGSTDEQMVSNFHNTTPLHIEKSSFKYFLLKLSKRSYFSHRLDRLLWITGEQNV
jgi:hypothetical protein